MYLKSIEIQGFKSFAKKTTLEFKNGITGIVGPNGSGKSNIADALRWVLGEQKVKQLRSFKMEDVIFSGTEKKNPLSFAYVAITFDNSDGQIRVGYSEVKIARRLYRSGESEYLLNGSAVRLKDVRELFYDTGIGKEGYSIIGQGQIDKILQGRSEERRELFDEACGIVKYKKRKAIAARKLENERLNLARTDDIISELEKRIGPLKRQSETANKFIDYKNELKSLEINLFLHESAELEKKLADTGAKRQTALSQLSESKNELSEIKSSHEETAGKLSRLEAESESLRNQISRGNIIRENLSGQINVLKEQINSANESSQQASDRLSETESSLLALEEEKNALEKTRAENSGALSAALENRNLSAESLFVLQNDIAQLEDEREGLKEKLIENVRAKGEITARAERARANREQIEKRRRNLEETVKSYLEDSRNQEEKINGLLADYNAQEELTESLKADISRREAEISSLEDEAASLNEAVSSLHVSLTKAETRLESARNIAERYEGYTNAIKEVMALKKKKKGIIGVVADIISVPEKYETAIETALGGNIQNIVTDNEATAKEAIEYLKKGRLGRATFLPLKAIKGRDSFRYEDALKEEGALGLASSLVEVDPAYLSLSSYLLGRILVTDNIDNALRIARKYRYSFIIVTLEGELLSRGGALSGGAYKNRSNLLGRRREIAGLEAEISDKKKKLTEAENKLKVCSERSARALEEFSAAASELSALKIYLNTLEISLSQARETARELKSSFENADTESRKAMQEVSDIDSESLELDRALCANAKEDERIRSEILSSEEKLSSLKVKEDEFSSSISEADIEISRLKEQQSFLVSSAIKAENNIARLKKDLDDIKSLSEGYHKGTLKRLEQIKETEETLRRADEELSQHEIQLKSLEKSRQALQESDSTFLAKHDEISERISALDKEVFRLEQMCGKYEEQFNSGADYIWHEYELTYNGALEYKKDDFPSAAQMKERISSLKASIRSLGSINVSAIEEYRQVSERYEFLTGQRDDIRRAEEDIQKIIKDLDVQMKDRFRSEFSKISDEFSRVFRIMFGGGRGSIRLCDENDILDSDIEITAQPPGKKLQNMMQLSGGEKALTAIAVLFAIQNLKPSPFCILDEIEAALDDANITKFANYLVLLSGKIQFIIITHRKGSMEVCDRLYGVTMQEKGVSSLISVNLEDAEKDIE